MKGNMTIQKCIVAKNMNILDCYYSPSVLTKLVLKTSQELRMLSSVTINCQVTKIVMNLGF